jgi:signal transduction histidine kinase
VAPQAEEDLPTAGSPPASAEFLVVVRDSGSGISDADRSRIWEPFYSGRAAGTGLGLSIVRAVVERHHGRVRLVESETGAAFEVRIPCDGQPEEWGAQGSRDPKERA